MRIVQLAKSAAIYLAIACGAFACGPRIFSAQGMVLNPTSSYQSPDPDDPHVPRVLVIERREIRLAWRGRAADSFGEAGIVKPYQDYASLPEQRTDGNVLYVDTRVFGQSRSELSGDGIGNFEFWLETPDGRRVKGEIRSRRVIKNHSSKDDGFHARGFCGAHSAMGSTFEQSQGDFSLYSRSGRIAFSAPGLVDTKTPYLVFVVKEDQRQWRYRFDFTNDPLKAEVPAGSHMDS